MIESCPAWHSWPGLQTGPLCVLDSPSRQQSFCGMADIMLQRSSMSACIMVCSMGQGCANCTAAIPCKEMLSRNRQLMKNRAINIWCQHSPKQCAINNINLGVAPMSMFNIELCNY